MPNRGRDIAPFLVGFRDLIPNYQLVLKLHTKKSGSPTADRSDASIGFAPATPAVSWLTCSFSIGCVALRDAEWTCATSPEDARHQY
jgi:hypothetical protein